jgi:hypothetical protein
MNPLRRRSLRLVPVGLVAALALTFAPVGSAQTDVGGSATGTGTYGSLLTPATLTLDVTGTPLAATGPVTWTEGVASMIAVARCIAIDETPTGFRASIAGEITGGTYFFVFGFQGFEVTVYDNTPPPVEIDRVSAFSLSAVALTTCDFEHAGAFTLTAGDFTITPAAAAPCPPNDDEDDDGLTDDRESLFSTLLGNADSDFDGVEDGNDDANRNGEDDEDEDDDEDDGCPDEDSDDDGEDDEDEDDDEDD